MEYTQFLVVLFPI